MQRDAKYWACAHAATDLALSIVRDKGPEALAKLPEETLALIEAYALREIERRKREKDAK